MCHTKRHSSSRTTEARDNAHVRKRERTDLEAARRASSVGEEAHKIRSRGMAAGASSSILVTGERTTTDGAEIDVGTAKGDPSIDVAGSGKLNPPTC